MGLWDGKMGCQASGMGYVPHWSATDGGHIVEPSLEA